MERNDGDHASVDPNPGMHVPKTNDFLIEDDKNQLDDQNGIDNSRQRLTDSFNKFQDGNNTSPIKQACKLIKNTITDAFKSLKFSGPNALNATAEFIKKDQQDHKNKGKALRVECGSEENAANLMKLLPKGMAAGVVLTVGKKLFESMKKDNDTQGPTDGTKEKRKSRNPFSLQPPDPREGPLPPGSQ